jgi:beta-glucanase (GH16 family)
MFKNKYVLVLAMVLLIGTMLAPSLLQGADASWTLVWSDECNGAANTAVDSSKWNMVNSGGGFGNGELQYYTNRINNSYYDGAGNLVIKAIKEAYSGSNYTSAKLYSQNKGDWQYCRIEIGAKLPHGRCIWPAFWMMPTASAYGGWPLGGEIDIMELRGDQMTKTGSTLHFGNPWKYISANYFLPSGGFGDAYHEFDMEWEAGVFRFYVDNNLFITRTHTEWYCSVVPESTNPYAPFDQRFYLQMNLAIGGPGTPFTGNQSPDDSVLPQYIYVDYVRVYQRPSGPTPTPGPTSTPTPTPAPAAIPGQIEAENWSAMSGVQTEATSDTGGGLNVGWIEANDWMDYSVNVNPAGTYSAQYRVASPNATGTFQLKNGATVLGSYTVPNTGGWQAWTTVTGNVTLTAGVQTLRILATGTGWNINWMKFTQGTGPTPTPPPATATPTRPPATPTGPVTPTPTPTSPPGPTPTPGGTLASATWYLFNTSVSGVTPAGQILQTAKSGTTGWQPTKTVSTTAAYWYASAQNGTYNAGTYTFVLWTNRTASSSQVKVDIYKVNSDGSGATLVASQTKEAGQSASGNHATTYTFSGISAVSLSNQRLMVKLTKASGVDCTMCYNTNDFPTRLVTP